MKVCGIKASHDATVAGIEDGKLIFSVELEKVKNQRRYTKLYDWDQVNWVLDHFNFEPDHFAIDGWRSNIIDEHSLPVNSYADFDESIGSFSRINCHKPDPEIGCPEFYASTNHVFNHIIGAYSMSPFANQECYVCTFDGGTPPRLHHIDPKFRANGLPAPKFIGQMFDMSGTIYSTMGDYFGPFKDKELIRKHLVENDRILKFGRYDYPGKLMAYIAKGEKEIAELIADEIIVEYFKNYVNDHRYMLSMHNDRALSEQNILRFLHKRYSKKESDATILLAIHLFLEKMLVSSLSKHCKPYSNLVFTGGSALNIKWNTALRSSGVFKDVWVPPVPNDTGVAIGAAHCEYLYRARPNDLSLDWNVYCGPRPISYNSRTMNELCYSRSKVGTEDLGRMLARDHDMVVCVIDGNAEIGPRALGNRSFLSSPLDGSESKQQLLNRLKQREEFRPISPICMEEHAKKYFDPGTPDPYMLFNHDAREITKKMFPGIVHIDGTSRLQTLNENQNPIVYSIMFGFFKATGVPILCNTSANDLGKGFFPDPVTAATTVRPDYIWNNGTLWTKDK